MFGSGHFSHSYDERINSSLEMLASFDQMVWNMKVKLIAYHGVKDIYILLIHETVHLSGGSMPYNIVSIVTSTMEKIGGVKEGNLPEAQGSTNELGWRTGAQHCL